MGKQQREKDHLYQGRKEKFVDEDRMVNEGLGGGTVTADNGLIEKSTVETLEESESILSGSEDAYSKKGGDEQ